MKIWTIYKTTCLINNKISLTLKGHSVSIESRNRISDSLKKYHAEKISVNPENNGNPTN
jgi:hypothetical protein